MERREDLKSILPFLPFILRSSSLIWPPKALDSLKSLTLGPDFSHVDSGEILFDAIVDIRDSLGLSQERLAPYAVDGFSLFFDELILRAESRVWFGEVVPKLASLLVRLPAILEAHYVDSDAKFGEGKVGLRLMNQGDAGIVFLSQELVAALLACALFCLFPTSCRDSELLPTINFDLLFASVHPHCEQSQEHKIKCIIHYFERICLSLPKGFVSFERKVLTVGQSGNVISYPDAAFWRKSTIPLCSFEAFTSGFIEDQQHEALEVDFANEYLGGGALHRGCVQEEIRFMISPELIVGMLFMVSMRRNEAIEIIGSERFSNYTGEMNKAYCGFLQEASPYKSGFSQDEPSTIASNDHYDFSGASSRTQDHVVSSENRSANKYSTNSSGVCGVEIGIATGNWGCGAFGGDPEIKAVIQWLAASQALRPFIHYYTFGITPLQKLDEVSRWILSQGWTVGDLWSILIEYSTQRLNWETRIGFLEWILPEGYVWRSSNCLKKKWWSWCRKK